MRLFKLFKKLWGGEEPPKANPDSDDGSNMAGQPGWADDGTRIDDDDIPF